MEDPAEMSLKQLANADVSINRHSTVDPRFIEGRAKRGKL